MKSKDLVWLHGEVKSPPFSILARREAGFLLRELQEGEKLSMPDSRPMPTIGARAHELRINDPESRVTWRIIYRIDSDAIIIVDVFPKKTSSTPQLVLTRCRKRLKDYDFAAKGDRG